MDFSLQMMDSVFEMVILMQISRHAIEARAWRGAAQKKTAKRLSKCLQERGFLNPLEAFLFFDMNGEGTLKWLEISAGLKKLRCVCVLVFYCFLLFSTVIYGFLLFLC